jgi:hypothetical protein
VPANSLSISSRLDFFNALIALGAKLPQAWPIIFQIIELLQQLAVIFGIQPKLMGAESEHSLSSNEEIQAQEKILTLFNESKTFGAIGDGSIIEMIRNAWAFIQSNPMLLQIVTSVLAYLLKAKPA